MNSKLIGAVRPVSTFIQKAKTGFTSLPKVQQDICRGIAIAAATGLSIYLIDPFHFFPAKKNPHMSDIGLKLQSKWFQAAVKGLERATKMTNIYGINEDLKELNQAQDVLRRLLNLDDLEVTWRLGRILVEQSLLVYSNDKKKAYLDEAEYLLSKAEKMQYLEMSTKNVKESANILKWRAIGLLTKQTLDKTVDLKVIQSLLDKALELDAKDPYTWYYSGILKMCLKKYEEAKQCFDAANSLEPGFSSSNNYNIALAQKALGDEKLAIETMKSAMMIAPRYNHDVKAVVEMRSFLSSKKIKHKSYYDPY